MTESNGTTDIPTGTSSFSVTDVSPTVPSTENPAISLLPTSIGSGCNAVDCPFNTPFPEPTTTSETVDSNTLVTSDTRIPGIPISTIYNSTADSTNSTNSSGIHISNTTIICIIIPIILVILSIIIGIMIYKRTHKKHNEGTILQFEPMHPHVVVVDADGNSLGKRISTISNSNNSNFTSSSKGKGNRSPSRMIKVLAYDNSEETGNVVGNNSSLKTLYYEDCR
ncbi:hypothetical protein RclHR1_03490002 [Rhizophagus clarus]|uniref:Uncharacterized protein n=1 Tax=Rhizophagus clarus TaxID=94130 RepID=A0A2Z6RBL5_9GLOM|nr:hypothetical protein RclHR1_03490002 [Rhizophagus clarus]GES89821.1 hypothetical protein GLOIN_2v1610481 [Rhizophagus clarus]